MFDRKEEVALIREKLLQAGLERANQMAANKAKLLELTPIVITQAAGLEEAACYLHFRDRDDLCLAIIEHGLNAIRTEVVIASASAPEGIARVRRSLQTYFDGNITRPGVRGLMHDLRNYTPAVELARKRTAAYASLMGLELSNCGFADGKTLGRLCAVLAVETVVLEYESGMLLPDVRARVFSLLQPA